MWCDNLTVTIGGQSLSAGHTDYRFEIYLRDGLVPGLQVGQIYTLSLSFDQMVFGDWRDALVANGGFSMSVEGGQFAWLIEVDNPYGWGVSGAGTYSWPFMIIDPR